MGWVFSTMRSVRYGDCDPAGIVFYPRYLEMVSDLVEDWFGAMGGPICQLHDTAHCGVHTVRVAATIASPSRLGDSLRFGLRPTRIGRTSVDIAVVALCAGDTRLDAQATLVHVSLEKGQPLPWPEMLRHRMEPNLETSDAP